MDSTEARSAATEQSTTDNRTINEKLKDPCYNSEVRVDYVVAPQNIGANVLKHLKGTSRIKLNEITLLADKYVSYYCSFACGGWG